MTRIENKSQYDWAVARVEQLLPIVSEDAPANDPNLIELELLSNLVADYSEAHYALGNPSLMDIVKLRMYEMGLNMQSLADLLGVTPAKLRSYFNGKSEPTISVARNISTKLDVSASVVLGL